MIDVFKRYAEDLGGNIIIGDALLMLGSAFIALFYKYIPSHAFISISSVVVYALTYVLFTRNPYLAEETKKKDDLEKEKEKTVPQNNFEGFNNQNSQQSQKIDAYKRMV
jgi:Na+/H+ antiporter NhaD/arsenite permease-like protein